MCNLGSRGSLKRLARLTSAMVVVIDAVDVCRESPKVCVTEQAEISQVMSQRSFYVETIR